jgi:predicted enzyme related to lactoylglutathione lyase
MTSYAPGNFCWCELITSDQNASKDFYSKVFGWEPEDSPMGPDVFYTMLKSGGKTVGALYGMDAEQQKRNVPPHWNLYIYTDNVDELTKKAESLGGKVTMQPFDVMDIGRMSAIEDPTGAIFFPWQAKKFSGAELAGEANSFCWWELNTKEPEKAKEFYTKLFGWTTGGDANYTEWKNNGESIGGMMEIQPEWGPVPTNWLCYIMVDNCDTIAAKIKELDGHVMMEPDDIPNMGRFAVVADPQRAAFALYQPMRK